MSANIVRLGGNEVTYLGKDNATSTRNCVILLNVADIPKEKIDGVCKKIAEDVSVDSCIDVVNATWLSESVKAGHFLNTDNYSIRNPHFSKQNQCLSSSGHVEIPDDNETKRKAFESKFVCSQSSLSQKNDQTNDLNRDIIEELSSLAKIYKSKNDHWRTFGYEKAIGAIKRYSKQIEHPSEVNEIPGLGKKMADKVAEILESGQLSKRVELQNDKKLKVVEIFGEIWGVGPTTAEQFYNQGFRSLVDLEESNVLTRQQQIGIKYYDDFNERMPREEAHELWKVVNTKVQSLRENQDVEVIACGSYRRGKATCGDLDILITHRSSHIMKGLFDELLKGT